jgi:hypothetical protein
VENRIRKFDSATQVIKEGPGSSGLWVGKDSADNWTLKFNSDGTARAVAAAGGVVKAAELTFTEAAQAGGGTYDGAVALPAGATLLDVIVNGVALWDDTTAAVLTVGGSDPDGYFTAVDLRATDLLAGESLSFALAGGQAGAYIANSQVSPRYSATARNIVASIAVTDGDGTAGRTRVTVVWSEPTSDFITAASFTATP